MDLWPAIDIRDGRCVRLVQGDFERETRYGDPITVAEMYLQAGAERIHVVDLDAALTGEPVNRGVIAAIVEHFGVPVQVGGGVRNERAAVALVDLGVSRVVLGTAAVEDPALVVRLAERWPGRVVAGLDYRRGPDGDRYVAVRGWTEPSGRRLADVLAGLAAAPLAGVVLTDIARDGTGDGPDLTGLGEVLACSGLPVVASGGVATARDLEALARIEIAGRKLDGAIVGRALLSGQLSIAEAVGACGAGAARPEPGSGRGGQ
jgi:phosphoribosylformimino-5-aminoimidazole carboxamide ribotide isomerase